jgi:Lrp/AsnC family leucine-responsive transcriptional regulator
MGIADRHSPLAEGRLEYLTLFYGKYDIKVCKYQETADGISKKMPESRRIDAIDMRILEELQKDGRLSNAELSRRVNLSPTPCLERTRRLEREGFIQGYTAILDPHKLGRSLVCFIEVGLDRTTPEVFDQFHEAVSARPEVQECHMVAGGFDYMLKVRLPDMNSYRSFLGDVLVSLPGVRETHTYVVMEEILSRTTLPLGASAMGAL